MSTRSIRRLAAPTLAAALGLGLSSCGGDSESPTSTSRPPDLAGFYHAKWTLQVLRKSDGFQKQFDCFGELTLVQEAAAGSTSSLRGFAVVDSGGCPDETLELRGSVSSDGTIGFTMDGPRPPQGPCPGGRNVRYTGQVSSAGVTTKISVLGETNVTCPEFGEHTFTYTIRATH